MSYNNDWLDEAKNMREDGLYEEDDLWDDEEEDEEEEDDEEEVCEFCEEPNCDGNCQDSWDWEVGEDPDEYWYGEDD